MLVAGFRLAVQAFSGRDSVRQASARLRSVQRKPPLTCLAPFLVCAAKSVGVSKTIGTALRNQPMRPYQTCTTLELDVKYFFRYFK
jgi:hypothetical protein